MKATKSLHKGGLHDILVYINTRSFIRDAAPLCPVFRTNLLTVGLTADTGV